ncbi:uncharacterized protein LOC133235662 [Bos javanicus]|uniref:uncharacterized protein LOC133235662 n=1 Tax=Bos javanicus TaxID=9906 RepID=UPI002AA8D274|nr:uncharacterized protein LOC133235662 [Bos javanicus]
MLARTCLIALSNWHIVGILQALFKRIWILTPDNFVASTLTHKGHRQPGPAGQQCAPARAAAAVSRSALFPAEPSAPARQPPPPRARLLWLLPAPSKRCLRLRLSARAREGGETRGREGRGALRNSQRGPAPRAAGSPRCAPLDPASPCARAACARVRSPSAGPWARRRRGEVVNVSPLGGLVRAQLGSREHGVKGRGFLLLRSYKCTKMDNFNIEVSSTPRVLFVPGKLFFPVKEMAE